MAKKSAIIIGAGYGGMALANILGKAGYKVDLFEKNDYIGGRIAAVEQDGFLFDLGPSWYLMPEVFDQYYKLFGLEAAERLDLIRFSPGYKVFFENSSPVEIQGDVARDAATFESIELGAGKRLEKYVANSTRTYELAVRYFLYNNFTRIRDVIAWPVIRSAPHMLHLAFRNLDNYVRSIFRDQRLQQLLEYHMVFLGSSPFQAPAIYSLMTHLDFSSGVYYPKRGMLSLVEDMKSIGESYDISYHTSHEVAQIITKDKQAIGIELTDGKEHHADVVIANADLAFTETKLLQEVDQSFPESYWSRRQAGPGALLISLGVKGLLPHLRHHNLYFVSEWRRNFEAIYDNAEIPEHASIYVCNPTKTDPSLAPKNHENLFLLVPLPANVMLDALDQAALADRMIATISEQMDIPDLSDRIVSRHVFGPESFASKFYAWQYNAFGGESHKLRQSILFRTANRSKKLKNLYYVGAGTLPGIGLPMCLISAELTYKRITGDRQAGPLRPEDIV